MLQPWQKATVIKIEQITHNTRSFFLQLDEVAAFDFKPGQFVTLDLPIHEKPHKRLRSYSIASWPNGTNIIELCIVLLDDGAGTTYLFNHVNVGDHITLRGPVGVFTLQENALQNDLFLICTGTGIAPFRSMVQWLFSQQHAIKNIYLIFGCRTQADLLYHTELQQLSNQMQGLHYLPTLSRELWEGATGYVHQVYESIIAQQPNPQATFMLCGWKAMIDEAKQRIIELGYDKKAIHTELYG
ncbi:ferredoxin--NADP reductase [Ferruginibacter yonginensis]|uniref:Ferredoxin--NADP reductase n=1 Tax=Ferruginibacter yonginensis TaxID=1310416 RepID=A0ABV8QQG4_9BACT